MLTHNPKLMVFFMRVVLDFFWGYRINFRADSPNQKSKSVQNNSGDTLETAVTTTWTWCLPENLPDKIRGSSDEELA